MPRTILPADLEELLGTVEVCPTSAIRLSILMHRNLAKRLAADTSISAIHAAKVRWLTPEGVLAASQRDLVSTENAIGSLVPRLLLAGSGKPPPIAAYTQSPGTLWDVGLVQGWAEYGADRVASALGDPSGTEQVVLQPSKRLTDNLKMALRAIRAVSAEMADEIEGIIRLVVFTNGRSKSATEKNVFGAIYLSAEEAEDSLTVALALIHECGHHSLALRQMFVEHLANPEELASHPLRKDPRPLLGVLHAGFVLVRMRSFLHKLAESDECRSQGWPREDVLFRRQDTDLKLAAVAETLVSKGDWTPEGTRLMGSILRTQPTRAA